jgi:nucleoside-diphosphate-sugar epimerase
MRLFCFGYGYCAKALAERLAGRAGVSIAGTRTRAGADNGGSVQLAAFAGDARSTSVTRLLQGVTHVLVSIPPDLEGDPALRHHWADLAALPTLLWVGYLSTIGVYGDSGGAWIDETAPLRPQSERALRRAKAEEQWRRFGAETGKRVQIFRLPGIYGPGRSVIDSLMSGEARRIVKPGQVFNRIHVADVAATLDLAMAGASEHDVFNVVDDEPAPPQDVIAFGAELLGLPIPPDTPFERASLSPMGRSFYDEVKRVRNDRIKTGLGVRLAFPTYREGLAAIVRG